MQITLKAHQVLHSIDALWALLRLGQRVRLRASIAYQVREILAALDAKTVLLAEEETSILRAHGALEDEGGFLPETREVEGPDGQTVEETVRDFWIEDPEELTAAQAARQELFGAEITLDVRPLSAAALEAAGLEITLEDAIVLGPLLVE